MSSSATLTALGAEIEWPATPAFELRLDAPAGAAARRRLVLAIALAARRGRDRHRVRRAAGAQRDPRPLPPRRRDDRARHDAARPQRSGRSAPASARPRHAAEAEAMLGGPVALPPMNGEPPLYERGGVVSALLATPEPVLVSQLRTARRRDAAEEGRRDARPRSRPAEIDARRRRALDRRRAARRLLARGAAAPRRERARSGSAAASPTGIEGKRLTKERALELARAIGG